MRTHNDGRVGLLVKETEEVGQANRQGVRLVANKYKVVAVDRYQMLVRVHEFPVVDTHGPDFESGWIFRWSHDVPEELRVRTPSQFPSLREGHKEEDRGLRILNPMR